MKQYIIEIKGMMCGHCELTVKEALQTIEGIKVKKISASAGKAVIQTETGISKTQIADALEPTGYKFLGLKSAESQHDETNIIGIITATIVITGAFFILRRFGVHLLPSSVPAGASYAAVFTIGLLTSLHCIVMCGGINLSQCASQGPSHSQSLFRGFLYNSGRLASYTVSGVLAGGLGSVFEFSDFFKTFVLITAGIFMIIMGLRITGIINISYFPKIFGRLILNLSPKTNKTAVSSFITGLLNVFIPCGPLQTMQLYSITTGDPVKGGITMFLFSLGTIPLMFGMTALTVILGKRFAKAAYRTSGVLIILMGLLTLSGATLITAKSSQEMNISKDVAYAEKKNGKQVVVSNVDNSYYQPIVLREKVPAVINFKVPEGSLNGCNNAVIIPSLGIKKILKTGDNLIEFTPEAPGTIAFSCWMRMIRSSITVIR